MRHFRPIFTLVLFSCAALSAQQAAPRTEAASQCAFAEFQLAEGFTVPGLEGATPKFPRASVKNIPGLFATWLNPGKAETFLTNYQCDQDHPGRVKITNEPIRVIALLAFDAGKGTFAYNVSFACETIYHGERHELACASSVFLYDLDGNGRFTLLRYPRLTGTPAHPSMAPEFIPSWAKEPSNP